MALLGCGSFGEVYKHVHNGMECAAKKLHAYVSQKAKLNFEKECEYLKKLQHPHIVQFYDVITDQQSGLPVLIMEHMFCNLTHYLYVSTSEEIVYHIQVSICCDVANGLTYLHSHQLAHRDLSSNNILLTDKLCAKIGDFGQAKLLEHCGPHTKTPGTEAYMPPEALQQSAMYDTKIDCYSLGVLAIQIITKKFPQEYKLVTQRITTIPGNYESEAHGHPLLHIAYSCLRAASDRPTAQQIYYELCALKHLLTNELQMKIQSLQQQYNHDTSTMQANILQLQQEVAHLREESSAKDQQIAAMKTQIHILHSTQQHIHVLPTEQGIPKHQHLATTGQPPVQSHNLQTPVGRFGTSSINVTGCNSTNSIRWSEIPEPKSPEISRSSNAVLNGTTVYFRASLTTEIHAYETLNNKWSKLPSSKTFSCSLAVIENMLTTIGGYEGNGKATNLLLSLKELSDTERIWKELLPPMPSERARSNSVCNEQTLIVAGGEKLNGESRVPLTVVEVMDIQTKQWRTVASLNEPALSATMVICNNQIYILGGWSGEYQDDTSQTVLSCSVVTLCQSKASTGIQEWKTIASLPVAQSTCTTFNGQLLAIGGLDEKENPTSNVYVYNQDKKKWEENSTLSIPRRLCFAITLPNNKILVVGGHTNPLDFTEKTNIMELGQKLLQ